MDTRSALRPLVTIALLLLAVTPTGPAPAAAQLNVTGQWSTLPYLAPINPIHVTVLHNGKVLIVAGSENNQNNTVYKAAVWDPATGTFNEQTTPWDLFCNGMSFLPDGRVIMTGGNIQYDPFFGPNWTTIFDPATETWSSGASMAKARWYPTTVVMPDGTILTLSGLDQNGQNVQRVMESYDPATNTWTTLPRSANILRDLFPRMVVLPDGTVFNAGSDSDTQLFDPSTNSWSFVDNLLAGYRGDDGTVLLPGLQRVLVAGGLGSGPLASAEVIDFSASHPQWTYTGSMAHARYNLNLVLLADGTALAVGGNQKGSYKRPVRSAELYDPNTAQWSLMSSQQAFR